MPTMPNLRPAEHKPSDDYEFSECCRTCKFFTEKNYSLGFCKLLAFKLVLLGDAEHNALVNSNWICDDFENKEDKDARLPGSELRPGSNQ